VAGFTGGAGGSFCTGSTDWLPCASSSAPRTLKRDTPSTVPVEAVHLEPRRDMEPRRMSLMNSGFPSHTPAMRWLSWLKDVSGDCTLWVVFWGVSRRT